MKLAHVTISALSLLLVASNAFAQGTPGQLTIDVDHPAHAISPTFYGLMTEEINHSYDGGLYGELIRNRSFGDSSIAPDHWFLVQDGGAAGSMALDRDVPANTALPASLRLSVTSASHRQRVGAANEGYWGIPVQPNMRYTASFFAKASDDFKGPIGLDIETNDGVVVARAQVTGIAADWKRYSAVLATGNLRPSETNRFVVWASTPGTVRLALVSLFPLTYDGRPNGNRIDLMQKLEALNPSFLRIPGGDTLEGLSVSDRFNWKETVGDISQRPGHHPGRWHYQTTDGLGLLELLESCEDLNVQPILAVYAGMSTDHNPIHAGPELQPFVDDALDEIEYVTGDASTKWGARRIADGHPAPFPLHYVEIGNEDGFDKAGTYDGRFTQFYDAVKAKYPQLQLIATTAVTTRTPDVYDDHYYRSASQMERDSSHYDNYDRKSPKIIVGEWASMEGRPTPDMNGALGDAAWLMGIERDSDVVLMEAYAPLLVNVNLGAWQWPTNLIGYDALTSFGSPSYYVQKMFGENKGDVVLPITVEQPAAAGNSAAVSRGGVGVGTWATVADYKDITVSEGDKVLYSSNFTANSNGWRFGRGAWSTQDEALRQNSDENDARATIGDPAWSDYTLRLKARKISGNDGFLILFHSVDKDNYTWWNVGGWGDTKTGLEGSVAGDREQFGPFAPVTVETGRWYDIRIEVAGPSIKCYLDDQLVTSATDPRSLPATAIYAEATRDTKSGDVILKVDNVSNAPAPLAITLTGVGQVSPHATGEFITGNPGDRNSIAEPIKIEPQQITITDAGSSFTRQFPAYSVSVVRLHAQ